MNLLFIRFFKMALAGILIPAFVFAQNSEDQKLVKILEEQITYRKQVDQISYDVTRTLCDAFVLRQKYQMGFYPDPATETYTTFINMSSDERDRYYSSLYEWIKIGNKGVIANWGFEENSVDEDQNLILLSNSRFTRTLVVTKGFFEAAKNCGVLDAGQLRKLLFEQEKTQATFTYIVGPLAALKGIIYVSRAAWPAIRATAVGVTLSKVPWSTIGKVAFGALVAFYAYGAWHDYELYQQGKHQDTAAKADKIKEENVQTALVRVMRNKDKQSEQYQKDQQYLTERVDYLKTLLQKYTEELEKIGETKIAEVTQKYITARNTKGEELSDEEMEIFMKAVYASYLKVFLGQ